LDCKLCFRGDEGQVRESRRFLWMIKASVYEHGMNHDGGDQKYRFI
jgi:hypothetical protein